MIATVDSAIRFAMAMLLASLWQAPLFALAAWLVLRLRPDANATTRHSILAAALFASLVLPVATATLAAQHGSPIDAADVPLPRSAIPYIPAKTSRSIPTTTRIPATNAGSTLAVPALARTNIALPRPLALALVAVWLAGAGFILIRLIVSLLHLERLKRDALPLPIDYRDGLTRWIVATRGSRDVRLCTSEEIDIPIAVGLFDAMILVPKHFLEDLAPHEVDSIVLHELAHLRRSDDWFNALERVAHALLFFNPGILWLAGRLDLEREVACDDWVLQQNDALPYATCLAKVAESAVWPHRPMTAPGAFVTRRGMSIRIERLLAKHRDVRIRTSLGPAGSAVAVLTVLGILAALVSPSIAYSVATPNGSIAKAVVASAAPTAHTASPSIAIAPRIIIMHPIVAAHPQITAYPHIIAHDMIARLEAIPKANASAIARAVALSAPAPIASAAPAIARAAAIPRPAAAARASDSASANASADDTAEVTAASNAATSAMNALRTGSRPELVAEADAPDYIDGLGRVGYTHLTVDELVGLKSVGVTSDFIRDLQRNGLAHPSVEELIRIRALGIDPQFIATMRARFGKSLGIEEITGMRAVGVDAEYAEGMQKAFGPALDPRMLAGLRAVGVTPGYVNALSAAGLRDLTAERVQSLRALSVTPDYIRDLKRAGFPDLTIDQVQKMSALDIDGAFVERAGAHGFHNLSIDQLIRLKESGAL